MFAETSYPIVMAVTQVSLTIFLDNTLCIKADPIILMQTRFNLNHDKRGGNRFELQTPMVAMLLNIFNNSLNHIECHDEVKLMNHLIPSIPNGMTHISPYSYI